MMTVLVVGAALVGATSAGAAERVAKKTPTAGFYQGKGIHYYDDGPVKVKAGNATAPLYAPMNGVPGQHNIALDNVAPGQTEYPPLWTIIAVQWKAGAQKTLLRSAADVRRAKAKGLLTTKR